ncbi:Serine/threonine-protein phosphatase 2A activator 2-like protein [Drosera capensis]
MSPSPPALLPSHSKMDPPPPPPSTAAAADSLSRPSNSGHTCLNCGGPTTYPPPSSDPTLFPSPPPSTSRPIRLPAVNLPSSARNSVILAPVPKPLPTPLLSPPFEFTAPIKRIASPDDALRFVSSESGSHFLGFVVALSDSVKGLKISHPCHVSRTVESIGDVIETLGDWIEGIPLAEQGGRYGNVAFRVWHDRLCENAEGLMNRILSDCDDETRGAVVELKAYFMDSFGNGSRIDYGTGHETNFAAWLYCLARLGLIREEDYQAVVLRVFVKYVSLMRKLQVRYSLEPAGSHGVWGLDDYHFLPFVFGSSQLVDHKYMKPKSIHNEDILENFAKEYMYLECVVFIKKVKKGLFAEHSPLLDDISGVPTWSKVNSGLLKMYRAEVLEKVPIMQHFLFGSIIKWWHSVYPMEKSELSCVFLATHQRRSDFVVLVKLVAASRKNSGLRDMAIGGDRNPIY